MHDSKPIRLALRAVVLDSSHRCLVLRRSAANRLFVSCWEWPGGKPDPGEEFDAALRREVREETGLEVVFTGLAGASEFELPSARIVLLCLLACQTGGELRLSHEHDAFDWVRLEDLGNRTILEAMKPILESLLKRKEPYV